MTIFSQTLCIWRRRLQVAIGVRYRLVMAVVFAAAAIGCDSGAPETVWIRGKDFQVTVTISAAPQTPQSPATWITLNAQRTSGPWERVEYRSLAPDAKWEKQRPPATEKRAAADVRWHISPAGNHVFGKPDPNDLRTRKVRFSKPGEYRVWAETHTWGGDPLYSKKMAIQVGPPPGKKTTPAAGVRPGTGKPGDHRTARHVIRVIQPAGEPQSIGAYEVMVHDSTGQRLITQMKRDRDGPLAGVWVTAFGSEKGARIWVWTQAAGSGAYGNVDLLAFDGKTIRQVTLPSPDASLTRGYMGHDFFEVVDGSLYRRFPVYLPGDPNATPSGGTTCLVLPGDLAGWRRTAPCPDRHMQRNA